MITRRISEPFIISVKDRQMINIYSPKS